MLLIIVSHRDGADNAVEENCGIFCNTNVLVAISKAMWAVILQFLTAAVSLNSNL